jgi:hypothetical protein
MSKSIERIETEKVTVKGYVIQGTHCVLKPTQHEMLNATFNQFVEQCVSLSVECPVTIDDHILTTIKNVTGKKISTFQVGADRTSNMSAKMIKLSEAINALVLNDADCVVNGKPMFIGIDDTPREYSGTFTLRTPQGADRLEYIKELTAQVKLATNEVTE